MISEKQSHVDTNIHEFFLDEELLLFSEPNSRVYRLNTSAAFIWCHQAGGRHTQETIQAMADTFGISIEQAQADVQASLSEWRRLGLLDPPPTRTPPQAENQEVAAAIKYRAPAHPPLRSPAHEHRYVIANTCFRLRFATRKTKQAVHPILAHLEVAVTTPFDTAFDIVPKADGYRLFQDSNPVTGCQTLEQLGPLVHAELLVTACKSAECLAILHAAAVTNGKEAFLLPGESGSGKSTLAAALIARGYGYLSDEIGLLTHHPYRILPVPLGIGMKEGAWPVLTPFHPLINKLPTYQRLDGKKVRYLPPQNISTHPTDGYPVKRLLFPRHLDTTTTQLQSISRAEALYRITKGGYDINGSLSAATVAELVNWISTIECYEIRYSCLPDALNRLQELM